DLKRNVLTQNVAGFSKALLEGGQAARRIDNVKKPDHRHRRLLRARRQRPCSRRAAEQRDKRAAVHSITSSARASSVGGISRPRAFAVVMFMLRSNLVGCSTGISAAFVPRRILST